MNNEDERSEGTKTRTSVSVLIEVMGASGGNGYVTAPLYDNTTFPPVSVCACDELSKKK